MVEGARLESVYTLIAYRGFESLPHRHSKKPGLCPGFSFRGGKGENPRRVRAERISARQRRNAETAARRAKAIGLSNPSLTATFKARHQASFLYLVYKEWPSF